MHHTGGWRRQLAHTLHLPTVKTYMKNNDLKFEPQLTEIDKGEEGEIAVEEWRAGGGFENQVLQVFSWNWTVTGMTLTPWHQSLRGSCESYTFKNRAKGQRVKRTFRRVAPLSVLCQSVWWLPHKRCSPRSAPSPTSLTPATLWK